MSKNNFLLYACFASRATLEYNPSGYNIFMVTWSLFKQYVQGHMIWSTSGLQAELGHSSESTWKGVLKYYFFSLPNYLSTFYLCFIKYSKTTCFITVILGTCACFLLSSSICQKNITRKLSLCCIYIWEVKFNHLSYKQVDN